MASAGSVEVAKALDPLLVLMDELDADMQRPLEQEASLDMKESVADMIETEVVKCTLAQAPTERARCAPTQTLSRTVHGRRGGQPHGYEA